MARKAYIFIFDIEDGMDLKAIHASIIALPELKNWSHYLKTSYILITEISSASILNEKILAIGAFKRVLVIELNLKNRNGLLPEQGWKWIKKQAELLGQ